MFVTDIRFINSSEKFILLVSYRNRRNRPGAVVTSVKLALWILNIVIALLSAVNAIAWGYVIKEVGDPELNINFILRLVFNKYFILAMASAFTASILSYAIIREMGVLVGRFFTSLNIIATILACLFVLGEKITLIEMIGMALIMVGAIILGK